MSPVPKLSQEEKQLYANTLEPHHKTVLVYPVPELVEGTRAKPTLLKVRDAHSRFEPLPLIDIPAVMHHAGRDNDEETSFFVIDSVQDTRVQPPWPRMLPIARGPSADERLCKDMAVAIGHEGTTILEAQMCLLVRHGEREDFLRIRRTTTYFFGKGDHMAEVQDYTLELEQFCSTRCEKLWFTLLKDLVWGKSDRAIRHVKRFCDANTDGGPPPSAWMPRRRPDFRPLIDLIIRPISAKSLAQDKVIDAHDKKCIVCLTDWQQITSPGDEALSCKPTKLLCGHLIGYDCITHWAASSTAKEKVGCPQCRQQLFSDELLAGNGRKVLQMGLDKGVYEYDKRYTAWENFERSCADLDMTDARDCNKSLVVDSHILLKSWRIIIDGAKLEPACSTPIFLQPQHFTEFGSACEAIKQAANAKNGEYIEIRHMWRFLIGQVYNELSRSMAEGQPTYLEAFQSKLSTAEWIEVCADPYTAAAFPRRPGFQEFVERSISRMLMFAELRHCKEDSHIVGGALHRHGERHYYR